MLIDEVEALWAPIAESDDWTGFTDAIAEMHAMRDAYGNAPEPAA